MKRFLTASSLLLAALLGGMGESAARGDSVSALTLFQRVTGDSNNPGMFRHEFELVLTNQIGTWQPGQGYGGIVFGDVESADSPIADFVMDPSSFPIGPWNDLGFASGFHNGPTLLPEIDFDTLEPVFWIPQFLGDKIQWAGFSSSDACPLAFSTLFVLNGADPAEFQEAVCVPEPATITFALEGAGLLVWWRLRRRWRSTPWLRPHPG